MGLRTILIESKLALSRYMEISIKTSFGRANNVWGIRPAKRGDSRAMKIERQANCSDNGVCRCGKIVSMTDAILFE
jgi:hypothetical protein